jgi:hypothetical protein
MPDMSQTRRTLAIVVLFLIGFTMIALADALEAWWPLFLTPLPYATIAWLVVKGDDEILGTPVRTLDGGASETDGSTQS